jgi:hypothetical protein
MMILGVVLGVWLLISVALAVVVGRSIKLANDRPTYPQPKRSQFGQAA